MRSNVKSCLDICDVGDILSIRAVYLYSTDCRSSSRITTHPHRYDVCAASSISRTANLSAFANFNRFQLTEWMLFMSCVSWEQCVERETKSRCINNFYKASRNTTFQLPWFSYFTHKQYFRKQWTDWKPPWIRHANVFTAKWNSNYFPFVSWSLDITSNVYRRQQTRMWSFTGVGLNSCLVIWRSYSTFVVNKVKTT